MSVLSALQSWYQRQCNGAWEEQFGVVIDTLDNPGWMVTIDLAETPVEHCSFAEVDQQRSPQDWIYCRVEDLQFKAACGPTNLEEVLQVFLDWAASADESRSTGQCGKSRGD